MRIFLFLSLIAVGITAHAQRYNGMISDNYAGNIAIQHNPANLADSRFRFNMNVIGFKAHLQNNYLQLETPHSLFKFLNWKPGSTFGTQNFDYPFKEEYVTEQLNGKDKYIFANTSVNAFSMQLALSDRSGISFGLTTKAYAKVANVPEDGVKTFLQDLGDNPDVKANQKRLLGQSIDLSKMGASALAYQQYGLKYAMVAREKGKDFIKIGFGLDYNLGLFGSYFKSDDVKYNLVGIDTLKVISSDMEFAYIDPNYYTDIDRRFNDYLGKSRLGRGVGLNVGIVYEHRPDPKSHKYKIGRKKHTDNSQSKYDWKIGASITDFGFVRFKNPEATRRLKIGSPSSPQLWSDFDSADRWSGINDADSFVTSFFNNVEVDSSFTMYTPATLNLSGDYKLRDKIYIAADYTQSLIRNKGKSVRMPNVLTIAPRYESKWLTVALPLSVSRYYNLVNLGLYVRGGIFYIGSDNLGGFFTTKKTNGASLYAGLNWPIHQKKLQDSDGDGISDGEDRCPDMPGTRYTDGCPDSDGDKIADDKDDCPNNFGSKRTGGCPDSDEDRVPDALDECPDVFGDKNTAGCPDSDGDGIHDGKDKCPEVAGEKQYDGCIEAPDPDLPLREIDTITSTKVLTESKTPNTPATEKSKFDNWDFTTYEYWPVLGAYNDIRWAEELQSRLNSKLRITTTIKTIPGVSKHYVTLGQANTLAEAKEIQKVLNIPLVNTELNGSLWWKKFKK